MTEAEELRALLTTERERADRAEAELAALRADADEALDLLDVIFTAYDEGTSCYEDPEDCAGFLGQAVNLDAAIFNRCVGILTRLRPRAAIDAARRAGE